LKVENVRFFDFGIKSDISCLSEKNDTIDQYQQDHFEYPIR